MNFELPEELVEIQRTVRELCQAEVAPRAREWDRTGEFPFAVVKQLAELGLLGIAVPEAYGGAGLGALATSVVVEEIARWDGSLALTTTDWGRVTSSSSAPRPRSSAGSPRWPGARSWPPGG
jgi:alkylation response protein AidB-like acyl-CoA dehydrogenase